MLSHKRVTKQTAYCANQHVTGQTDGGAHCACESGGAGHQCSSWICAGCLRWMKENGYDLISVDCIEAEIAAEDFSKPLDLCGGGCGYAADCGVCQTCGRGSCGRHSCPGCPCALDEAVENILMDYADRIDQQ